jgi:hypothetical protein
MSIQSEIIHRQFEALAEAGYLEAGLFPQLPAIENRVLASAKFLFGVIGWVGTTVLDFQSRGSVDEGVSDYLNLFNFLDKDILAPNRFDHLPASIAEDRHWIQIGKDKMAIAHWFSQSEFRRQLELFHRQSQPKQLGKLYKKQKS